MRVYLRKILEMQTSMCNFFGNSICGNSNICKRHMMCSGLDLDAQESHDFHRIQTSPNTE